MGSQSPLADPIQSVNVCKVFSGGAVYTADFIDFSTGPRVRTHSASDRPVRFTHRLYFCNSSLPPLPTVSRNYPFRRLVFLFRVLILALFDF